MNTVEAFIFQCIFDEWRVVLVWERADIAKYFGDDDYEYIGSVTYDTEKHRIVKEV